MDQTAPQDQCTTPSLEIPVCRYCGAPLTDRYRSTQRFCRGTKCKDLFFAQARKVGERVLDEQKQTALNLAPRLPARQGDPLSSVEAAVDLVNSGTLETQALQVLRALFRWPHTSSMELSRFSGIDRHLVAKRLVTLEDARLVRCWGREEVGERKECSISKTSTGKPRKVMWWSPTELGRKKVGANE